MRISLNVAVALQTHAELVADVRAAAARGLAGAWWPQLPPVEGIAPWEPLTSIAAVGPQVPELELGTAVAITPVRHPLTLATQALTAQAATGGRLTLGLGTSHAALVTSVYGLPADRPVHRLDEYLDVLLPALTGAPVDVDGDTVVAHGRVAIPGVTAPSVLIAALGPRLLELAGRRTDGTIATWAGPRALGDHIVPTLAGAASTAGRPSPRVIANALVAVTDDPDGLRAEAQERFGRAGSFPSYARMFELDGASGPGDAIVVGDEAAVLRSLQALVDAGATEVLVTLAGSADEQVRTLDLLADLGAAPVA